jgi:(p)ppGpp synthase/HD superfamily hydrolase
VDDERFLRALELAIRAHDGQVRTGTSIPYIAHPIGVASLVMEDGGSDDETAGALLHDAVEDGGEEYVPRIRDALGDEVLRIVLECSDSVAPRNRPKAPWRERKLAYVGSIPTKSAEGVRVSTADKLHNARAILADLRSLGVTVFDRFHADRDGVLWYYRMVGEALAAHPDARPRLADELLRTVGAIEELAGDAGR